MARLVRACQDGNVKEVRRLIQGRDPRIIKTHDGYPYYGGTLLHVACWFVSVLKVYVPSHHLT